MEISRLTQDLLQVLETIYSRRATAPWSDFSQGELKVLHHLAACGRAAMLPGELSADLSHADRRKIHVYLTKEGRHYIEKRYEYVVQSTKNLVDYLGAEDATQLVRILNRIADKEGFQSK